MNIVPRVPEHIIDELAGAQLALAPDGVVVTWSPGAVLLYGYSAEESVGRSFLDLVVPAELAGDVQAWLDRAVETPVASFESDRRRKDGSRVQVESNLRAIRDSKGQLEFIALNERDITRLVYRRNSQLLESRFRGLLEAAPDAMVVIDQDGRIVLFNSQVERLFGYQREELVGQSIEILVPRRFHGVHPGHRARYFAAPQHRAMGAELDLHGLRKDGSEFPAEISLSPMESEIGPLATAAIRDITGRKKTDAKFRGLLEAAPDAMVIANAEGRIVLVNAQAERMFGYAREELLDHPIETLIPSRFHGVHPAHRQRYSANPRPRPMGTNLELHGRRKDGEEFPVEISLSPLETEEGPLVTAAIRDVTGQKEQYRRVQEANRLKSEFLANMSHELRTPLNAVIGFAEIIHDGRTGPISPEQKEYLGDILTSSRHLLQIINDVLDLAKVEAGRITFRPEAVDLSQLVAEVRDGLRTLAASKAMPVEIEIEPGIGPLWLDPARLKQVLYNYLSNAIKFTPEGRRVVIRARPEGGDHFRLEVEDAGIGIAPEDIERLFVEFQQLDSSATKKYQGTGLGLALTRQLVEAQGGHVGVTSAPGVGSTFFAILPCAPAPVPVSSPEATGGQ